MIVELYIIYLIHDIYYYTLNTLHWGFWVRNLLDHDPINNHKCGPRCNYQSGPKLLYMYIILKLTQWTYFNGLKEMQGALQSIVCGEWDSGSFYEEGQEMVHHLLCCDFSREIWSHFLSSGNCVDFSKFSWGGGCLLELPCFSQEVKFCVAYHSLVSCVLFGRKKY